MAVLNPTQTAHLTTEVTNYCNLNGLVLQSISQYEDSGEVRFTAEHDNGYFAGTYNTSNDAVTVLPLSTVLAWYPAEYDEALHGALYKRYWITVNDRKAHVATVAEAVAMAFASAAPGNFVSFEEESNTFDEVILSVTTTVGTTRVAADLSSLRVETLR